MHPPFSQPQSTLDTQPQFTLDPPPPLQTKALKMIVYHCTADDSCGESFTSSKDWHRHDSSQHYYNECWLCTEPSLSSSQPSSSSPCLRVFYSPSAYEAHLVFEHKMIELEHRTIEAHHLGPNASRRFWCGFCSAIIELTGARTEAWPERWRHLEAHLGPASRGDASYVHYITSE